ncbi:hypothetical protein PROFUN_08228 [Planoprotostelium fungivorum]|uniref:Proliferating cell nuclear antigen n=1 Tax=Planoprotostelium fungivorum TaxID=1890364 RepID=A0A2P6NK81_9EUKA|nr:hypothetical protein PROFUN_08228 [Planoprotostelium fungivorum]
MSKFRAVFKDARLLSDVLSLFKDMMEIVQFDVSKEGIGFISADNVHANADASVFLIDLLLAPHMAFHVFDNPTEPVTVSVSLKCLCGILKQVQPNESLTMEGDGQDEVLTLVVTSPNKRKEFKLRQMDIMQSDRIYIPDMEYPCEVLIPPHELVIVGKELSVTGDAVLLKIDRESVLFNASEDLLESSIQLLPHSEFVIQCKQSQSLRLKNKFFARVTKMASLKPTAVLIQLKNNFPLSICFSFSGLGNINLHLAPLLDEESTRYVKSSARKKILGTIAMVAVVVLWVTTSEAIQYIFVKCDYNKPFFLTLFSSSLFSIYLIGFLFIPKWRKIQWTRVDATENRVEMEGDDTPYLLVLRLYSEKTEDRTIDEAQSNKKEDDLTLREVIKISAIFAPIWFAANYSFNLSLTLTSVSSNTILSTTSSLFILIIGIILKTEKFTLVKLAAVILSISGVVLVSLSDRQKMAGNSLVGNALSLLSAVLYAAYVSLLKHFIGSEDRMSIPMFFGFLGLFNLFFLSPLLPLLHVTRIESFILPDAETSLFLTFNGLFGTLLSDYLWMLSILMAGPLIATLGLSLTSVFAMVGGMQRGLLTKWQVVDLIFRHARFSTGYVTGASLIVLGFLFSNSEVMEKSVEKMFRRQEERRERES